jgi:hypothetical protein
MPTYEIEQYELHTMKYRIEARNEAEAIAKLFDGDGEPVKGSLEYIEICDDRGLPADEHQDLAEQLHEMGIPIDEAVIPSVRSIALVKKRG